MTGLVAQELDPAPTSSGSIQVEDLIEHLLKLELAWYQRQSTGTLLAVSDTDVRQGIKEYANWPTIPQLYVKGEFVGGCDIITEMNGEKIYSLPSFSEKLGQHRPGDVARLRLFSFYR